MSPDHETNTVKPEIDFLQTSVVELAEQVRAGEVRASTLVEHALGRIEERNLEVNAFVAIDAEAALAAATEIDRQVAAGKDPGPLAGIPIGVKDLEPAAGFVTTFGSALHVDDPPAEIDSLLVTRLKAAGAIVIGKTNTPEFGHTATTQNLVFGATANPLNLDHTPGGSSGGSAAAIASGMVPLATGSDGGGSIRIPSALCGLTGLKCQQGRIPYRQDGSSPAMLLATGGPMARTAADTAWALDAARGPHWADPFSLPPDERSWYEAAKGGEAPSRVVWSPTMGFAEVDPEIASACRAAVDQLAAAGTEVIVDDTVFSELPMPGFWIHWLTYMRARLEEYVDTPDLARVTPHLQDIVAEAAQVTGVESVGALTRMFARNHDVGSVLERHDAQFLLTPTIAQMPPTLEEIERDRGPADWVQFTFALNMTRHPAGSVPVTTSGDLPVGLQVIGRHFDEPGVLAAMSFIEQLQDLSPV